MAKKLTREEIITQIKEENVRFIRLQFTDMLGTIKNVEIPLSQLDKALDNKMAFDGSSIEGFVRIEESDMLLHLIWIHSLYSLGLLKKEKWRVLSVISIIRMVLLLQAARVIT